MSGTNQKKTFDFDFDNIKDAYINKLFDSAYSDKKKGKTYNDSYSKFFLKYKDDKDHTNSNFKKIDDINIQKLLLTEFKILDEQNANKGKKKNKNKVSNAEQNAEQNTKEITDKIADLYKKYIIIKYIYDTDNTIHITYNKNKDVDKEKLLITLNENNSIATIVEYNATDRASDRRGPSSPSGRNSPSIPNSPSGRNSPSSTSGRSSPSVRNNDSIINYLYFLDKEDLGATTRNNNQFLLIWNYNIYSIKNIAYNGQLNIKGKFHLNYIYIYILYRIFYYFLNICINLTNNLKNVKYSVLYDAETVNKIIQKIELWDRVYTYNSKYITDKQNGKDKDKDKDKGKGKGKGKGKEKDIETILELYNTFFTKLIQNILSNEALDIDVKISQQTAPKDRANVAEEFIKRNKNNMIIEFLTLLYDNIVAKLKKYNPEDYYKAIELYNIYRSICAYKDANLEKLENIIRDAKILNEHKEALTISNEATKIVATEVTKNMLLLLFNNNSNNVFSSLQEYQQEQERQEQERKRQELQYNISSLYNKNISTLFSSLQKLQQEEREKRQQEEQIHSLSSLFNKNLIGALSSLQKEEEDQEYQEDQEDQEDQEEETGEVDRTSSLFNKNLIGALSSLQKQQKQQQGEVPGEAGDVERTSSIFNKNLIGALSSLQQEEQEKVSGETGESGEVERTSSLFKYNVKALLSSLQQQKQQQGEVPGEERRLQLEEQNRVNGIISLSDTANDIIEGKYEGKDDGEMLYYFKSIPYADDNDTTIHYKNTNGSEYIKYDNLLNSYNYLIYVDGNNIINVFQINRYYNLKHILYVIYKAFEDIIIISKKNTHEKESNTLYQYTNTNLIFVYKKLSYDNNDIKNLRNFTKLILDNKNTLKITIGDYNLIKEVIDKDKGVQETQSMADVARPPPGQSGQSQPPGPPGQPSGQPPGQSGKPEQPEQSPGQSEKSEPTGQQLLTSIEMQENPDKIDHKESDQLISAYGLINLINGSGTYTISEIQNQFRGAQSIINLINGSGTYTISEIQNPFRGALSIINLINGQGTDVTPPPAPQLPQENNFSNFVGNNFIAMFSYLNNTKHTVSQESDQLISAFGIINLINNLGADSLQTPQTPQTLQLQQENNISTFFENNLKGMFYHLNNTKELKISQESKQLISAFGIINLINNLDADSVQTAPALQLQQENNISTFFENNLKGVFYHLNNTKELNISQESEQLISAYGLIKLINSPDTDAVQTVYPPPPQQSSSSPQTQQLQLQQENNISTFFENNLKGMFYHLNMNNTKRTALPQELNVSYASDQLRTAFCIIELIQSSQTVELESLVPLIQAQEPENNTLTFVKQNFKDIFSSLKKIGQDSVIDSDDSYDSEEERERERESKKEQEEQELNKKEQDI